MDALSRAEGGERESSAKVEELTILRMARKIVVCVRVPCICSAIYQNLKSHAAVRCIKEIGSDLHNAGNSIAIPLPNERYTAPRRAW